MSVVRVKALRSAGTSGGPAGGTDCKGGSQGASGGLDFFEKDLLEAGEDALAACPHLFQEEIRKDFELRIVVVGSRVFPFRIDSQKKKLTQFDWRYGHFLLEFTECRIPEKVETGLKRFLKAWNLVSGSFDLIVDKLGQFWFLECNQDGAWGWLDETVDGRISDAFVTTFSEMISKPESLLLTAAVGRNLWRLARARPRWGGRNGAD